MTSFNNRMTSFNNWLAQMISDKVGTMYCAYLFAVIGIMGVTGALTGNTGLVLVVGAISGYFLQLVLLPVIMVAGKLQGDTTREHVTKKHEELKAHITATHKGVKK